jgi:hypothetical protein
MKDKTFYPTIESNARIEFLGILHCALAVFQSIHPQLNGEESIIRGVKCGQLVFTKNKGSRWFQEKREKCLLEKYCNNLERQVETSVVLGLKNEKSLPALS